MGLTSEDGEDAADGRLVPDFFVVGTAKAGTTALHTFLSHHPDIALPARKETNFYALGGEPPDFRGPLDREGINTFSIWTREAYEAEFSHANGATRLGEVCPWYLYSEQALQAIHADNPRAKVVMVLREPVSRAFSAYRHLVRDGRETRSFAEAIALEERRIRAGWEWFWHLTAVSRYADQVARYQRTFGHDRVKVFRYEDLKRRPQPVLAELLAFVGVEPDGPLRLERQTMGTAVALWVERTKALWHGPGSLWKALGTVVPARVTAFANDAFGTNGSVEPKLDPGLRRELVQEFRPNVRRLQAATGLDLEAWTQA